MIPQLKPFIPDPELKKFDLKYDKKYKIPVNYGLGLKWKGKNGNKYESVFTESNFTKTGKRAVRLVLSNMLYSFGASHYYARYEIHGPSILDVKEQHTYMMTGYGPEYDAIQYYLGSLSIEVERRLTKVEKDLSGERIGKIGDWTYRFNSEEDAKAQAIATFPKRFAPGWALLDDMDSSITILET